MLSNTNTTINGYGALAAEIYDIDKPFGALPDTAFHLPRLADIKGEILEPACGTGRTLIPLLEAGHIVAGYDQSEEMLERCRRRAAERGFSPDLRRQRHEGFAYDRSFAAIIFPVGSFTLIDNYDTAMAVLRRFHDHLDPGGLLVIDLDTLGSLRGGAGEDRRHWTADNGDLLTLEGKWLRSDWIAQRGEYQIRYERWRDNRLLETQLEPMAQRYWGLEEFKSALSESGFGDIVVSADYQRGRPIGARARTLTYEAVRR